MQNIAEKILLSNLRNIKGNSKRVIKTIMVNRRSHWNEWRNEKLIEITIAYRLKKM